MRRRHSDLILPVPVIAVLVAAIVLVTSTEVFARTTCSFSLGFKALHDLLPDVVGDCLENEQVDPVSGDLTQRTTNGQLMWHKSDNWTAFTDGPNTYISGPNGIASRPTDGPRLPWEPQHPPPPPSVARSGTQAAPSNGASRSTLFHEDFDDPAVPICTEAPISSFADFRFACPDGELRMWGTSPPDAAFQMMPPGSYGNASFGVDVRFVDGFERRSFIVYCRENADETTGYALLVTPALRSFVMGKRGDDGWTRIVGPTVSDAIKPGGGTNRLEISCVDDVVTGRANGIDLGSFQEGTYRAGRFRVSANNGANVPLPIDVRFDNMVVTER